MILIHYNRINGDIIQSYSSNIDNPPYPNIIVTEKLWDSVCTKNVKVDLRTRKLVVVEKKLSDEEIDKLRAEAYREESDPIFFKYQRKEAKKEDWINKVNEIKKRYPKSTD